MKDLRDEEKGILKELGQRYFQSTEKELLEVIRYIRGPVEMLVELTAGFKERFGEAKREKNILDFTDMEHFALQILMTKEGEEIHMSQAARELSAKYDEVLVDEYQDSNLSLIHIFAGVYDVFMDNVNYREWADYIIETLAQDGIRDGLVLELGGGTGTVTEMLADAGYDMIGIDNSEEMLAEAMEKRAESGHDILYLLQDVYKRQGYKPVTVLSSSFRTSI